MNTTKLFEQYHDRTIVIKSINTQNYEKNLMRVNKKCLEYLKIKNLKSINLNIGYQMVRYYNIYGDESKSIKIEIY